MTTTRRPFPCPATQVFAVLTDPETYPQWLVGAKHIRRVDAGWPEPGTQFHHVVGFGPLAIPDSTTSIDVETDCSLELLVKVRPLLEARVRFELERTPEGCTMTMTETPVGPFRVLAPLTAPLIRLRNDRSMDRLAGVVERASVATR